MYKRHEIGKKGEEIAAKYLEQNNYKIIKQNFRCKQGEIDIIAIDKQRRRRRDSFYRSENKDKP